MMATHSYVYKVNEIARYVKERIQTPNTIVEGNG